MKSPFIISMNANLSAHRLALARDVLSTEAQAIESLSSRLDETFLAAVDAMLATTGRVVVTGMGKSGHVARKIAATLASTGTAAFYVHPGEAAHGDLGMVTDADIVLALSYSGESDELLTLLPALKRQGNAIIAMTGREASTLAREADIHLDISVPAEACPLALAPTSSTTASLAMGDALAVALLEARGFTADDFARSHPAGSLGRRLLVRVADVMRSGDDLPAVPPEASLRDALMEISRKGLGLTAVVDTGGRPLGIFTDGDLRRLIDRGVVDFHHMTVGEVMHVHPKTIASDRLATEAVKEMEQNKINGLLVLDNQGRVEGALNLHDLFRAGVV